MTAGRGPGTFTLDAYRRFLDVAVDRGFGFRTFHQAPGPGRTIHLRHDLDNSVDAAVTMAELEAERGVTGTYFCMLRSANYNALDPRSVRGMTRIADLGHEVGLHYWGLDGDGGPARAGAVRRDCELLGRVLSRPVDVFSFHNPGLAEDFALDVPGLVNVYAPAFFAEVTYLSESNMGWRDGPPEDHLVDERAGAFQILVHPFSYVGDLTSDRDVLLTFLELKCHELLAYNQAGVASLEADPVGVDEVGAYLTGRPR